MEVNIHQAKTHLSRLIARAVAGEEVIIAKSGHPLVRLTRIEAARPQLGTARGKISFQPGWDDPLGPEDVAEIFGQ